MLTVDKKAALLVDSMAAKMVVTMAVSKDPPLAEKMAG